jgi:hypothetical protein
MADFTHTWTTFIQPSLTPAVALIGALSASFVAWRFGSIQAGIARQQAATAAAAAATAKNKLKLELFERRVAMYDVIYAHIESAAMGPVALGEQLAFSQRVRPVSWLLDDDIARWVYRDLGDVIRRVQTARAEAFGAPNPSEELQIEFASAQRDLTAQLGALGRMFDPYLRLEH